MRPILLVIALAFLQLVHGIASAADLKPLVINPSTGLQQQLQAGDRLKLPTASGGFFTTLDPGVQTGTQVFSFPITAGNDTLVVLGLAQTFTAEQTFPAGTTAAPPINIGQGVAPTSPTNGDVWLTSAGLFAQAGGVTAGPFGSGGGGITGSLVSGRVPFASGVSTLTTASTFTYAAATGLHTSLGSGTASTFLGSGAGNTGMTGSNNVIIGEGSGGGFTATANSIIIGAGNMTGSTSASGNIVIGTGAGNTFTTSAGTKDILLGNQADVDTATRSNALIIGSATSTITDSFIGAGVVASAPVNHVLHATGGTGTDIAGSNMTIAGGQGTGTGVGGAVIVRTAPHSTTGGTANALAEVARFSEQKNFLIGTTTDPSGSGEISVAQAISTSGSPNLATFTGAAHTTLAATVESPDVIFNLARSVQFATGGITNQRAIRVLAPTYTAVGASVIANCATFAISGSPISGTNITQTNSLALRVESGTSQFMGQINIQNTTNPLSVSQLAASSGTPVLASFTGGAHTALTASTEAPDVTFNLAQIKQHATGAIATNRHILISAPTDSFVGASTITTDDTLAISGAPIAGTNATLTAANALHVQGGNSQFDGRVTTTASTASLAGLTVPVGTAPTAPVTGDMWNDSTQLTHVNQIGGLTQAMTGTICTTSTNGTVANTTSETSFFGTLVGTKTLPANFLKVGKTIRVRVAGLGTSTGTPSMVIRLRLGATLVAGTLGTLTMTNLAQNSWTAYIDMTCQATGASGSVVAAGFISVATATSPLGNGFGTAGATIDTTVSQVIDVTGTWSAAAPLNSFICYCASIEVLN